MILLCGIPSESPLALVQQQLEDLELPYVIFNQRNFADIELQFEIKGKCLTGSLTVNDKIYPLENFTGIYTRLMDDQLLPELRNEPENSSRRKYCRALHTVLLQWYEIAPARVVNRTAPMGSNFSKPYQAQLIKAQGFEVPETLITNDPELVMDFNSKHHHLVYKSISGVRSIVQTLHEKDLARLEFIRWCPTQFQEFIEGVNVRVHTINRQVFATRANTEATDYRYAQRQVGKAADLEPITLSDELAEKCLTLASALKLDFAGIDLKITPDGRVYCFEVNPSPAYTYYESNTGQPIARAVANYLAGK
jgi:glutathione synthase/RimK-type ligase-like ATP-grasp enzyme